MGVFAVIPFSESRHGLWASATSTPGILFIFALTSIGVYGISLAGWSSGSKFPLLGSVRSTAQMISYELAMTMSVVGVLILAGTTSLAGIVHAQNNLWFIVPQFVGFVIYLITAVAETNRAPFDLVEAETELVGGFHTEYSGLRFGLFFIAEYLNMISVACVATLLFLGGWNAAVRLDLRSRHRLVRAESGALHLHVHLAAHDAAAPALRPADDFGWKFLLPVATLNLMVTAAIVAVAMSTDAQFVCRRRRARPRASRRRFSFFFKKKPTIAYPSIKKQHAPRFHGLHELRRYADGKERCIGCELCAIACPANAITVIGAENAPDDRRSPGRALRGPLRDRRIALHLLRTLRRGVSDRCDRVDAALRDVGLSPRLVRVREGPAAGAARSGRRQAARRASQRHSGRPRLGHRSQGHGRHRDGLRRDLARRILKTDRKGLAG